MIGPVNASYICLCVAIIVLGASQLGSTAGKVVLVLGVLALILMAVKL